MSIQTKRYLAIVMAVAAFLTVAATSALQIPDPWLWAGLLGLGALASACKVRIPGLTGHYSLNFLVLLAAMQKLTWGELIIAAAACALVQSYWRPLKKPSFVQVGFNASNLMISISGARGLYTLIPASSPEGVFLRLLLAAAAYYALNTAMTSAVLCLVGKEPLRKLLNYWTDYTLAYYTLGAAIVSQWIVTDYFHAEGLLLAATCLISMYLFFRHSVSSIAVVKHQVTPE